MRAARLALLALVVLGARRLAASASRRRPPAPRRLCAASSSARTSRPTHTFSRTPGVRLEPGPRGASCYEFELATSRIVRRELRDLVERLDRRRLRQALPPVSELTRPARTSGGCQDDDTASRSSDTHRADQDPGRRRSNLTLPWFTGKPYALYAHVRAVTTHGATAGARRSASTCAGRTLRSRMARGRPRPLDARRGRDGVPRSGTPDIRQASSHAHERRRPARPVHLPPRRRLVADRRVARARRAPGRRARSRTGFPQSRTDRGAPMYATTNPAGRAGKLQLGAAVSDVVSSGRDAPGRTSSCRPDVHRRPGRTERQYRLFRVYVVTDRDCVNVVFRGSVVGGPAFAPRSPARSSSPRPGEIDTALTRRPPAAARTRTPRRTWPTARP